MCSQVKCISTLLMKEEKCDESDCHRIYKSGEVCAAMKKEPARGSGVRGFPRLRETPMEKGITYSGIAVKWFRLHKND